MNSHRLLILGAGLVTRPIVRYFLGRGDTEVTVASLLLRDAQALVADHPQGRALAVDVSDEAKLEPLIRDADVVVSLLPYVFHVQVARLAIRHRADLVTTSYVSPEMRALDDEARRAGVMLLNEVGLDPGLDHMSAVQMIDDIRRSGGRVNGFVSCCGGLPAPEAADNPWRYKFSWSPRGVLLAARLGARYLDRGVVHHIPGSNLFGHWWPREVEGLGAFEMYPNRDSLRYVEVYGLEEIGTMLRGTLRYPGWCETMKALVELGLLDVDARVWPEGSSYADMLAQRLPAGDGPLRQRLAARLGLAADHAVLERLAWAGLFDDEPLPPAATSPLDVLAERFQQRMRYGDGQRDMVVLRHELTASWPGDRPAERRVALLVAYGEPGGDSATARTVSLPAALASALILEGRLHLPGVQVPNTRQIADPILEALGALGLRFVEHRETTDLRAPLLPHP